MRRRRNRFFGWAAASVLNVSLFVAGAAESQAAGAQVEPRLPAVSARGLYVSCYLFAQGADVPRNADGTVPGFSAMACGLYGVHAAGLREGRPDRPGGFCMGASAQPGREMGAAYVAYLEAHPAAFSDANAEPLFRAAMQARWPCKR